jgi:hypothetical protein
MDQNIPHGEKNKRMIHFICDNCETRIMDYETLPHSVQPIELGKQHRRHLHVQCIIPFFQEYLRNIPLPPLDTPTPHE